MNERLELSELLISFLKTVNIELRGKKLVLLERNEQFESGIKEPFESGVDVKPSKGEIKYCGYQCPSANIVFSGVNGYLTGVYLEMDGLAYRVFEEIDKHNNAKRSLYINHIKDGNLSQNGIVVSPHRSQQFSTTSIGDFIKGPYKLLFIECNTSGVVLSVDNIKNYGKQEDPLSPEEVFSGADDNYAEMYRIAISKAINIAYATDDKLREAFLRSSSIIGDTYEAMAEIPLRFEDKIRATLDTFETKAAETYVNTGNMRYLREMDKINKRRGTLDLYISSYLKTHDANTGEARRRSYHTLYY